MQNLNLNNYREKLFNQLDFDYINTIGDITKNDFLKNLSFLENQLFNKTQNIILNYQIWLLIYLKKLFYDSVYQNYKYLQNDYKKFILKIYDFFELDKNKNSLTYTMYEQFENSLTNDLENSKNFSENYYSKISWKEFLEKSFLDSEYSQEFFKNCFLPWNIEILEFKNQNNEFVLNIYADDEILLNLADLVLNKILTQDIFYKITFQVNFYNSRKKDFDYKKILGDNKPLINLITSKYELLLMNLIKTKKQEFLRILDLDLIFDLIKQNLIGFDPLVENIFITQMWKYKKRSMSEIQDTSQVPNKFKMIYFKKSNLSFEEFVKADNPIQLFVFQDKPFIFDTYHDGPDFNHFLGHHHLSVSELFDLNQIENAIEQDLGLKDFEKSMLNYDTALNYRYQGYLKKHLFFQLIEQMCLIAVLCDETYEICGYYEGYLDKQNDYDIVSS